MEKQKQNNIYKLVQTIAIIGIFVAVAILVLGFTEVFKLTSGLFVVVGVIGVICGCCLLAAPWVRRLERNEFKILSWVFIGLIAACCILWIICVFEFRQLYLIGKESVTTDAEADTQKLIGVLKFFKACAIISIQFVTASTIASTIVKYQKSYIPVQAIMYVSHIYVDFFVTFFICCFAIKDGAFEISDTISVLGNKGLYVPFILCLCYVILANAVVKRIETKKVTHLAYDNDRTNTATIEPKTETTEDKLANLKSMYEKDLLTKEEYEAKRAEILKDFK